MEDVVSPHPTTTTFKSPPVSAAGYVTETDEFDAWIVLGPEATCTNPITVPTYVKPEAKVPLWPSVLVTTTFTDPAVCAGVMAVICVALTTVTAVAAVPPNITAAPDRNPVPVTVIDVPPAVVPDVGEMAVTVGAGLGEIYV